MLHAAEPLLFRRRDKFAVTDEGSRRIAVEGVKAEDDHARSNIRAEPLFAHATRTMPVTKSRTLNSTRRITTISAPSAQYSKKAAPNMEKITIDTARNQQGGPRRLFREEVAE